MRSAGLGALIIALTLSGPAVAAELRPFSAAELEQLGHDLQAVKRRTDLAIEFMEEYHDPGAAGISEWVTEKTGDRFVVRFLRHAAGNWVPVVDAVFTDALIPELRDAEGELTPFQAAQVRARARVEKLLEAPCARNYESIALPDPAGEGFLLYVLPVEQERTEVLVGGQYRFSMTADGGDLRHADALSTACTITTKRELAATTEHQGVAIRALLSDTPLESHVYLSLHHGLPLFVVTRDLRLWRIEKGHMQIIREAPGEAPSP